MPPKRVHANDGGAGTGKKKGASAPAYTAALQLALGYSTLEQPNDAAAQPLTKGDLTVRAAASSGAACTPVL